MEKYHKIQTIYDRDPETNLRTLIDGQFSKPEFEYLKDNTWVFTEKVNGINIRIVYRDGKILFQGKSDDSQIPSHLVNRLNEHFLPQKAKFAEMFDCDVCLYGEGYGAKIQKGGGNYRPDQHVVLFDVRIGEWWLRRGDVQDIAMKLGVGPVPIIGSGTLQDLVDLVKSGFDSHWGSFTAEGIVARPMVELQSRGGERIITKLKYKDFNRRKET